MTRETLEKIDEILKEIHDYSTNGTPIIVEGEKDEKALRELDIPGPVYRISGSKETSLNFLEQFSGHERVLVLTDFDHAGDNLADFCVKQLEILEVETIIEPRRKLKWLVRKYTKDIEGLPKFLRRQKAEVTR